MRQIVQDMPAGIVLGLCLAVPFVGWWLAYA